MTVSFIPILLIDVLGSVAMVILSLLSLYKARKLRGMDPANAVFLYLIWISTGFTVFAVSRSFGHILRQFLNLTGNGLVWQSISAYSGSVNTASFMLVGLITLFFNQSWKINEKILSGREKLETAHLKLMDLNQTLEQKVIERTERLTSSEHKCRRIFEQSLDTIIVADSGFRIQEINASGIELTGYNRDAMIIEEMTLGRFFQDTQEWERICAKINQEEYILNEEAEFLRSDGKSVFVLITGGVDYGAFGCAKSYHFIIKNVDDKRNMERQIAQADKLAALGELSAGVAHEINNPLGIILGYTQLMLKEQSDFEDDLKIIEKHVKNCKTVVSDLLAFSRKGSLEMQPVEMNKIINDVISFLSNHADFRNVDIHKTFGSDETLMVYGNEQELGQVVINLMINACHAVKNNGQIEIETFKTAQDQILIKVKDNGTGIRKKDITKIFDPFFTTKPLGQGTGLGLSVGYGIIKRHGGKITVRNRSSRGTEFSIKLPAYSEENHT